MPSKNLLENFVLKHIQISRLSAELVQIAPVSGSQEAKVELNLTPRLMQADSGDELPSYQVSARLSCQGGGDQDKGPSFTASVGFEAVYQQISGEPVDVSEFTANHASLTRQLYPLLQTELRGLLSRLGLEQIHLPFDLAARAEGGKSEKTVEVSGSLH
ncbi:MAG: hypothetical protein R3212_13355 [Xanthomonadales bacterium]|nr:hypothetical protein [Xanthomonadales bacterium]